MSAPAPSAPSSDPPDDDRDPGDAAKTQAAVEEQLNLAPDGIAEDDISELGVTAVGCPVCMRVCYTTHPPLIPGGRPRCKYCLCDHLVFAADEPTLRALGSGAVILRGGLSQTPPHILTAVTDRLTQLHQQLFPFTEEPGRPLEYISKATANAELLVDYAGCVFCRSVYPASEIREWIPDRRGLTAMCPRCPVDAVVPVKEEELTLDWYRQLEQARQDGFGQVPPYGNPFDGR